MRENFAFLFPGQGSQKVGMLSEAAAQFPEVAGTLEEASDALGYDLTELVLRGDSEQLNLTEYTQPALLATSVALWRAWLVVGGAQPTAMAGHSLGEFSALCCAGAIELSDAVKLVRERGRFMQSAVPVGVGAMAAVLGLDDELIIDVCAAISADSDGLVQAVNFNSPGQVVIAGHSAQVDEACEQLKQAGARRCLPLAVSAPFHTDLMQPAGDKLRDVLGQIPLAEPQIPVIHNVNAATASDSDEIRALLVAQISAPVRWTACVEALRGMGVSRFAECGAGKVLGGLLRRIDRSLSCVYLEEPSDLRDAIPSMAA